MFSVVHDDLGRRQRQRTNKMPEVAVHAEVQRIAREVHAGLRVLAIALCAEKIKVFFLKLYDKRAFGGVFMACGLSAAGHASENAREASLSSANNVTPEAPRSRRWIG